MNGVVKRAINRTTGDEFAVKIITKTSMDEEERIAMNNEILILSQIDHPNVIKLFETYETNEELFLVMELMKGGELFDRIVENEFFTEREAKEIISPIVDAVNYWHELNIIHRDLKPENLLYESSDEGSLIKISDFGIARFVPSATFATTAWGTPGYVAPEVIMGKKYGKEVDVWSIGVILYILLWGYPPFYSESNSELFEQIKEGKIEFQSPYWDEVSDNAKDLIRNLLTVDPNKRIKLDLVKDHEWFRTEEKLIVLKKEKSFGISKSKNALQYCNTKESIC